MVKDQHDIEPTQLACVGEDSLGAKEPSPSRKKLIGYDERVLLVDQKQRRYLVLLRQGGSFHTHAGIVSHDDIAGHLEGSTVMATTGRRFVVFRPTLSDIVLKMPRGAQVIYPKDLGAIVMGADLGPGMRVLEAGVGSGALSMAMLRAGACVVGYERRTDFAEQAAKNVRTALGIDALICPPDAAGSLCPETDRSAQFTIKIRDVYDGIDERGLDRIVLDLPEPARVVPHALQALRPGGILLAYLPTINQVAELRYALERSRRFALAETSETMRRTWHVEARSVRPDHRMVAHTGFITAARLLAQEIET